MKRFLKHRLYFLILLAILFSMKVKGDSWASPKVKTYYSKNKEFKLVVTPKIIPEKYNEWAYYKRYKNPQKKKISRREKKFMQGLLEKDTILTPCFAKLYRINETDSILIWNKKMLNDIAPTYAIVANDGSSIATTDNWHYMGYGGNVFVVYNEKGEAKRTYKLEEISPFPLNDYFTSISSIWWNTDIQFIDNVRIEIVFKTEDERQKTRIYNVKKYEFEE